MTESEQVKAALAALAAGESEPRAGPPAGRTADGATAGYSDGSDGVTSSAQPTSDQRTGGGPPATDYRAVIERAVEATGDLEAAAAFVESVGLDRLEAAVERAALEVSGLADEGRDALATFERFRVAAQGPVEE